MKLEFINIENVGCIKNLTIDKIDPHMNVITGPNGVGKTTLLKAVCSILTNIESVNLKRNARSERGIISGTLCEDSSTFIKSVEFTEFTPDHRSYSSGFGKGKNLIYISDNREFDYLKLSSIPRDLTRDNYEYNQNIIKLIRPEEIKGWFVNRYLFSAHADGLTDAQRVNFEHAKSAFSILDESVKFKRVDSHSLDILLETSFGSIYFEYLSSGFKSLIILILGIIKEIEFRFSDENVTVDDFDGIVVIDEVDIHLHPTWQAKIVNVLQKVFPKVQFFVSTHSPHVVQSLPPNQLIALEKVNDNIVRRSLPISETGYIGWTVEEILKDVMRMSNTNSDVFQKQWNIFTKAIENEDFDNAQRSGDLLLKMLHPSSVLRKVIQLHLTSVCND